MIQIVLITHNLIGQEIFETAVEILGYKPCQTSIISIRHKDSFDKQLQYAQKVISKANNNDDILILTDIKGASPYNIAIEICPQNGSVICNIDLAMMIGVFNYCKLTKPNLIKKLSLTEERNDNNER